MPPAINAFKPHAAPTVIFPAEIRMRHLARMASATRCLQTGRRRFAWRSAPSMQSYRLTWSIWVLRDPTRQQQPKIRDAGFAEVGHAAYQMLQPDTAEPPESSGRSMP